MSEPEYIICLACESPTYVFEWRDGKIAEAVCEVCGNDELDQFATEEELEELDVPLTEPPRPLR